MGIDQLKAAVPPATPMSALWLSLWAAMLAPAWLLPNHYPPWSTFHLDAWAAGALLVPAVWLAACSNARTPWSAAQWLLLAIATVPGFQYATGLIVHAGTAWVNGAYLLGLLIAWQTGARWESVRRGQAVDGVLLAVGLAALFSVGLQLHQWLQLDRLDIWSMGGSSARPYANLGQPNQLGTLLLWGLMGLLWGILRERIRPAVAVAAALFVVFGLALTGSRTAWVAVMMLNAAVWCWRRYWPSPRMPWAVMGLTLVFFGATFSIDLLSQILLVGTRYDIADIVRAGTESRPAIWALFLDAAMQRPWWGYGWGQTGMANVAAALAHPPLHMYSSHAHNLFLDLVIWCGWPIGIAASAFLVYWFVSRAVRVRSAEDATLVMALLVVGNHAMLELPLHHAYFLLPVGMLMGALEVRLAIRPLWRAPRWVSAAAIAFTSALLGLIVRDYARVEPAYQNLRFQWAGIKTPATQPPELLLLTQWRDFFRMVALGDGGGPLAASDIAWAQDMTGLYPYPGFFQLTAIAHAINGQPEQAARWLSIMCNMSSVAQCAAVQTHWRALSVDEQHLAAVPWPAQPPTPN